MPCTVVLIGRVQGQVNDVMDVMRGNIDKMMQRGERLDNLEEKSGSNWQCIHSFTIFRLHAKYILEGRTLFWPIRAAHCH